MIDHIAAKVLITDAIGFDFEPNNLQSVNESDLLKVYEAGYNEANDQKKAIDNLFEQAMDRLQKEQKAWFTLANAYVMAGQHDTGKRVATRSHKLMDVIKDLRDMREEIEE